jgi:hypothetical protein
LFILRDLLCADISSHRVRIVYLALPIEVAVVEHHPFSPLGNRKEAILTRVGLRLLNARGLCSVSTVVLACGQRAAQAF